MQKNLLESALGQLSAITISGQQVLPSKLDACANVTTCCSMAQERSRVVFREAWVEFVIANVGD